MEVDSPSNSEASDDGVVKRLEAKAKAVVSELRMTTLEVAGVVPDPTSIGLGFEGSQACEIDFGGLFAPSKCCQNRSHRA
ncbi:hypothetical protein GUJ93_ZPchr0539g6576 [Zizania palustris]|uniref:Uncharacterized protein n=1 Tax=Zizania palustris TaxID=103762 RepID=A0A8J5R7Q7_ZIZPA|nr:hypothetical protein GUJ93_ZPchr0539g6576 [Zizania palustris]